MRRRPPRGPRRPLERRLLAGRQRDRAQLAEALGDRLEHGAHRCDDDGQPTVRGVVALGCASGAGTDRRCPTVSLRGLSRSCGRVSQDGKRATASAPSVAPAPSRGLLGLAPGRGDGEARGPEGRGARARALAWRAPAARGRDLRGRGRPGPRRGARCRERGDPERRTDNAAIVRTASSHRPTPPRPAGPDTRQGRRDPAHDRAGDRAPPPGPDP